MTAIGRNEVVFDGRKADFATGVVFAASLVLFALSLNIIYRPTSLELKLATIGGTVLTAALVLRDLIRRVRIGDDAFIIEYAIRSVVIRYADVTNVEIVNYTVQHKDFDIIAITRRHRRPLKLVVNFEEGVIPVYSDLQRRWTRWNEAHRHAHAPHDVQ